MRAALAMLLGLALAAAVRQEAPAGEARGDLYPCRPCATVVRFFHLETDSPDLTKISPALAELEAVLVHGPRSSGGRPGHSFVAVRVPRAVSAKKVAAALKKGGGGVEALEATAFDGRTGSDSDLGLGGVGVTKRDLIIGISNDVVWYDASGTWSQFYGAPRKLEADELAARYAKLYAPYGGAKLGAVVHESLQWTLTAAPTDKQAPKLEKSLEKLPGVTEANFSGNVLALTFVLDGLEAGGDAGPMPESHGEVLEPADAGFPRLAFDTGAVYEILLAEKLVP